MSSRYEKEKAIQLRLKGFSYNEINKKIGVPKSTLSGWLKNVQLSDAAAERLNSRKTIGFRNGLLKRNKRQTHLAWKRAIETQNRASKRIGRLSKKELLVLGAALYWGEGHKRLQRKDGRELPSHAINFTNSDPEMIQAFILFLRKVMGVDILDMKAAVRLYQHQNEADCVRYWVKVTGIPVGNFNKSTYQVSAASKKIRPYNRLPFGTIRISVNDTAKFHMLMGWIEGLKKAC